jgi:hypothetical protein
MSTVLAKAPIFKPFNLALIQLGRIGANKADNLKHAREMVLKAARGGEDVNSAPNLIVLPVYLSVLVQAYTLTFTVYLRKSLTRLTAMCTFLRTQRRSDTFMDSSMMLRKAKAKA